MKGSSYVESLVLIALFIYKALWWNRLLAGWHSQLGPQTKLNGNSGFARIWDGDGNGARNLRRVYLFSTSNGVAFRMHRLRWLSTSQNNQPRHQPRIRHNTSITTASPAAW